jgi:hypothetical protein
MRLPLLASRRLSCASILPARIVTTWTAGSATRPPRSAASFSPVDGRMSVWTQPRSSGSGWRCAAHRPAHAACRTVRQRSHHGGRDQSGHPLNYVDGVCISRRTSHAVAVNRHGGGTMMPAAGRCLGSDVADPSPAPPPIESVGERKPKVLVRAASHGATTCAAASSWLPVAMSPSPIAMGEGLG